MAIKRYALVKLGVVREIIQAEESDLAKLFHPDLVADLVASDTAQEHDEYDGQAFAAPAPPAQETNAEWFARLPKWQQGVFKYFAGLERSTLPTELQEIFASKGL